MQEQPLVVVANVVDITQDRPRKADVILIDTNVLFWQTYTRASQGNADLRKIRTYGAYVALALKARSDLVSCALSFFELCHVIEQIELQLCGRNVTAKDFRRSPDDRQRVLEELRIAWSQVEILARPIETFLEDAVVSGAMKLLDVAALDGVDATMLEVARRVGVDTFLTDDSDFCGVPGINLFTGNHKVIQAAQAAGRLIRRETPGPVG